MYHDDALDEVCLPVTVRNVNLLTWNTSYLDRINVSNARLAGMQEDLHMTDVEWSAGISLFYVGYIISQVPGNVWVAKSSPRIILPCIMLAWSAVTIAMPAVTAPWGFMLCRFLVGVTEGPCKLTRVCEVRGE
jgi:MFS family permease